MDPTEDFFTCPHCGARVPSGALACRQCGSDAETGWSEDADLWTADIPSAEGDNDDFDYNDFVAREFPGLAPATTGPRMGRWLAGAIVVVVALAFLLWSLF